MSRTTRRSAIYDNRVEDRDLHATPPQLRNNLACVIEASGDSEVMSTYLFVE
jgi:hypothetical protein